MSFLFIYIFATKTPAIDPLKKKMCKMSKCANYDYYLLTFRLFPYAGFRFYDYVNKNKWEGVTKRRKNNKLFTSIPMVQNQDMMIHDPSQAENESLQWQNRSAVHMPGILVPLTFFQIFQGEKSLFSQSSPIGGPESKKYYLFFSSKTTAS